MTPWSTGLACPVSRGPRESGDTQALILTGLEKIAPVATPASGVGRTCLIFADNGGVADRLVAKLKAGGSDCITVRSRPVPDAAWPDEFAINRDASGDYRTLFEALKRRGQRADTIVFLWPLDCEIPPGATPDQLDARLQDSCGWLLDLLRA